jgi:predicted permease
VHRVSWISASLKLLVMPAAALGLGTALGARGVDLAAIACCAAVPSTSSAYVLARQMGGNAPLMAEIITLQTLLAMGTMPVVLFLVGGR